LNGVLLKKKFQTNLIFEIRDIWPFTLTEEGGYSKINPLMIITAWIEKWGYCKSDLIVGTMPNLNEHIYIITGREINFECIPFGFELK
jgi:hypothetical protein